MSSDALKDFHPLIAKWFRERYGEPTDIQVRAWREVAAGEHILITAPTGSGKTLAAFLWSLNELISGHISTGGLRILYISPLKALNNDVRKNLLAPLGELRRYFEEAGESFPTINVQTRSGDTPGEERRRMMKRPPEILITTPESLNIMLASKNWRGILTGIRAVIMDEIHALVASKRGTHFITAIDRLTLLCGEFQRIALSATVKPLEGVAAFAGGYTMEEGGEEPVYLARPVKIVRSAIKKRYVIKVDFPENAEEEMIDDSWWPVLVKMFKEKILQNESTLLFTNSRRITEKLTRFINEDLEEELAYSHHGSLSREIRLAVEEKLKGGELKSIVATNSLELGIDIGKLDEVFLVQTPPAISSAIQRVGRAGHNVGEASRGTFFPTHGMDFINAAIAARSIMEGDIETFKPIEAPLDVLSQIIIAMAGVEVWDVEELYHFLKTSYPYRNLNRKHYEMVLEMLAGKYADSRIKELNPRISIDRVDSQVKTKEGKLFLIYTSGGTIPDRGYFNLRLQDSKAKIGELDEEFVWERAIGETFPLGNNIWRIQKITHNDVEVIPAERAGIVNIVPFWKGEDRNRDFHFSCKISNFIEEVEPRLNDKALQEELERDYYMSPEAARRLVEYLKLQKSQTGTALPHRHHLLVEHFDDPFNKSDSKQLILHTLWGGRVNKPFAIALSGAWEERYGYPLQSFSNNDCVSLMLPHGFQLDDLFSLLKSDNVERMLRVRLERSGLFGARFRENSQRALLLLKGGFNKRTPLWVNRLRSKKLLSAISRYKDFPILLETWRECLQDEFDLDSLRQVLDEIEEGKIELSECITNSASPFTSGLIWRMTDKFMYEDDRPLSESGSSLSDQLIKELLYSTHLRPRIPAALIAIFQAKALRTAPGYLPFSPADLLDWLKERLLITEGEWRALLEGMAGENGLAAGEIEAELKERAVKVELPGSTTFYAALETLPQLARLFPGIDGVPVYSPITVEDGLGEALDKIVEGYLAREAGRESEQLLTGFILQWLNYYGPLKLSRVRETLGLEEELFDQVIRELEEEKSLIIDIISDSSSEMELCTADNLDILLRMTRKSREPAFNPLPLKELPLFLAHYQGLTSRGSSMEELQECMEQLLGYPAPAAAWEEQIIPARLSVYYKSWLDSLLATSGLCWLGCGNKRLTFTFPEDLELYRDESEEGAHYGELLPNIYGKYNYLDISSHSKESGDKVVEMLWEGAWEGYLSNDSFTTVRNGIIKGFNIKPFEPHKGGGRGSRGRSRWNSAPLEGSWYYLAPEEGGGDLLSKAAALKDRVRQLLSRYGILFKELTTRELPQLRWGALFRTLRLMELSGEIISGTFFEGIPGLQFTSPQAFRQLQKELPADHVYWMSAIDPASLCGLKLDLETPLPTRLAGNYLVYRGSTLALTIKRKGKELHFHIPAESVGFSEILAIFKTLLNREFNSPKKITVEKINDRPAKESEYLPHLVEFGFKSLYKGVELWKF